MINAVGPELISGEAMIAESAKLKLTDKVMLCDGKECKLVELSEIRYFESFGNYTKTWFNGGQLLICRSLSYLDSRLARRYFFRANRQHIINISHIKEVQMNKISAYRIEMSCGKIIDISRRRSQLFRDTLSL
jgi:two-component system, LytTR family, response regulator